MIIVSIQRQDIIHIDYVKIDSNSTIETEKENIINLKGDPLNIGTLETGALSMKYYSKDYGHESIMIIKA